MTADLLDSPPIDADDDDAGTPVEHACKVCGAPVTRTSSRGRWPEYCTEHSPKSARSSTSSTSSTRRSSSVVDTAADSMLTLYQGILFPLGALSPRAASTWAEQIDGLDQRNRLILAANPKLAKQIVDSAAKGGAVALVMSHVMAIAPVGIVLAADIRERRAASVGNA